MIHVLYAEDNEAIVDFMQGLFEATAPEMTLEIARTGTECLDRMRQGGVDILLLDLKLPGVDGLEILGELSLRGDHTPVVMVSGHGQTELAVKALRAGALDCVDKASPQFPQIVEILRRQYSRSQSERVTASSSAEPSRRHQVVLIESNEATRKEIGSSFARSAPLFDIRILNSAADLDNETFGPDAVLIGPEPGGAALDLLRMLRSRSPDLPVILVVQGSDAEMAVAAFKLGAEDYILISAGYLTELNFSLGHALNRAALARNNARLSRELEAMNRSLEAQVAARTRELEALSMRFINVREDEGRAIARELHDDFGQLLTGLKFQLEEAAQQSIPSAKEKLADALASVSSLLEKTRDITLRLRPVILDDLGLQPAIEWHLNLFQRRTGITVESEFSLPVARLPGELETTIFRIVQEALTNVARHSGSRAAHVMITSEDRQVIVEIADRGGGFDLETVRAKRDSMGLVGLTERARLAGGALEIISRPGRGTRVRASFPMPYAPKPNDLGNTRR